MRTFHLCEGNSMNRSFALLAVLILTVQLRADSSTWPQSIPVEAAIAVTGTSDCTCKEETAGVQKCAWKSGQLRFTIDYSTANGTLTLMAVSSTATTWQLGDGPMQIFVGQPAQLDLNGDGRPDLALPIDWGGNGLVS